MLNNVLSISKLFFRMARFPNEKILSDELCKITEALEAKDVDTNSIF